MQQTFAKKFNTELREWIQAVALEKMREPSPPGNGAVFSVCLPNRGG